VVEAVATDRPAVLVVDDNPLILNIIKSLLASEQYQVRTACNGSDALQELDRAPVDVIVCDVMMPEMDGYEFHRRVRERGDLAHVPFVFLTALSELDEVSRGAASGADDYVTKPFEPRELLAIVHGKIDRARKLKHSTDERYESYRKRVLHTLSHEFRTPLVAINTGAELLIEQQSKLDLSRAQSLLEAIRRGGERLERLVSDFMVLQQIEAGVAERIAQQRLRRVPVSRLIEEFVTTRREWLDAEQVKLTVRGDDSSLEVSVYEPQIQDILWRLTSNSVKFSPQNREVEISFGRREMRVCIEVRDRGVGFDVKRITEAMRAFGQLDRERQEQQGGGLGLSIALGYARINRGGIEFEAREGGGTIARMLLPIAEPPEE
jgi:DNA-binding response OmpR family regulator